MVTPPRADDVDALLRSPARWAVVGLSDNTARAAYGVSAYLQRLGHTIVPVHPAAATVHGARGYRTLSDLPEPPDVVDVFVNSARAGAVVDEAVAVGARAVWLQLGVHADDAVARARAAGVVVVQDACPAIEGRARDLG
ncbi:CoA-binding protein [Cellulomonas sp. B6]|uniref:CoA-binding protein n=1 Tax=Cellulomonas sp. B6 TaxID=1295626 RepID=UPI00073C7802|nr:CoA-binding protein [Cellulomonas sp. B6]KSW28182.1 CoA-binding protein [Cellulomonas sp. B6]